MGFGPIMVPGPVFLLLPPPSKPCFFFSACSLMQPRRWGEGTAGGGGEWRGLEGGLEAQRNPQLSPPLLLLHHPPHHGDDCQHGPRSAVAPPSKCELAESCRGELPVPGAPLVHTYIGELLSP